MVIPKIKRCVLKTLLNLRSFIFLLCPTEEHGVELELKFYVRMTFVDELDCVSFVPAINLIILFSS